MADVEIEEVSSYETDGAVRPQRYVLKLFYPNDNGRILAHYESATPFMPIHRGDVIDVAWLDLSIETGEFLRATEIFHVLSAQHDLIRHEYQVFTTVTNV